jgi:hypothetical protein
MLKRIVAIIGAVIVIASLTGAAFFMEDRYAKAESLKKVNQRLDIKILQDQINFLQQQMWQLEDRCQPKNMTYDQKVRYREMKERKIQLEKELNITRSK